MQQQERNGEEKEVHDDVRVSDPVYSEVRREGKSRHEKSIKYKRENKSGDGQNVDVPASVDRHQCDERELRENREDVCDALDSDIRSRRVDYGFIRGHKREQLFCKDKYHRRQYSVYAERHEHPRAHAVRERFFVLFYLPDDEEQRKYDRLAYHLVQKVNPRKLPGDRERPVARKLSEEEYPNSRVYRRAQTEEEKCDEELAVDVLKGGFELGDKVHILTLIRCRRRQYDWGLKSIRRRCEQPFSAVFR